MPLHWMQPYLVTSCLQELGKVFLSQVTIVAVRDEEFYELTCLGIFGEQKSEGLFIYISLVFFGRNCAKHILHIANIPAVLAIFANTTPLIILHFYVILIVQVDFTHV